MNAHVQEEGKIIIYIINLFCNNYSIIHFSTSHIMWYWPVILNGGLILDKP